MVDEVNSSLTPKAEDIKNSALPDSKTFKAEDSKDVKDVKKHDSKDLKREDTKDSKPVNITEKDGDEDEEIVFVGMNKAKTPALVPFGMYKAESRDTEALLEPQGLGISERSPDNELLQHIPLDHSDTGNAGELDDGQLPIRQNSPLPASEDVEMNAPDESVPYNQDGDIPIADPPSDDEMNANVDDQQPALNARTESSSPPPPKRRRVILDAVVLPTLASILGQSVRQQTEKEEIEDKIKMLSNPIVKKKPNIELSIDTVRDRMKSIGYDLYPIPLEKDIQDVTVTRQFMSDVYGGSPMETSPKISEKKLALHGLDDFMFLNLNLNPQAPQFPGAPGLFFTVDSDPGSPPSGESDGQVVRLFSRLMSAIWLYCGQYEIRQVRNAWATQLCIKGWGIRSRARIHLRQSLRREPTDAELTAALISGNEYKHIQPAQFSEAFLLGQETMAVYTMKCIDYDTAFQRNLAEKFPTWAPPPSKSKGEKKTKTKKNGAGGKPKSKQASKANSNKRKQEDLELSDSEESANDDVVYSENDQDEQIESVYVPRGTRSRPIQLE